jgi:ABC-type transport system involved in multi-copper enzyme maturation permease subunit
MNKGIIQLIKKEFKEKLPAFIVFLAVVVATRMVSQYASSESLELGRLSYFQANVLCVWPLFFLTFYLGISTFINEKTSSTMTYLMTLPVTKLQVYLIKLFTGLTYSFAALAILPAFVNDSAGIGWDDSTTYILSDIALLSPALLFTIAPFATGLIGSVACESFQKGTVVSGLLFITPLILFARYELMEASNFLLVTGISFFLISGHLLSSTRQSIAKREIIKRFCTMSLAYCSLTYIGLHGWNIAQQMMPATYNGASLQMVGDTAVLGFDAEAPLLYKRRVFQMMVDGNSLKPLFSKRNHLYISASPDKKYMLLEDARNHWGFYTRNGDIVIYTENGEMVHQFSEYASKPIWSPDSKRIAYVLGRKENEIRDRRSMDKWEIRVLDMDGKNTLIGTVESGWNAYTPTVFWSRDEGTLVVDAHDNACMVTASSKLDFEPTKNIQIQSDGSMTLTEEDLGDESLPFQNACKLPGGGFFEQFSDDGKWAVVSSYDYDEKEESYRKTSKFREDTRVMTRNMYIVEADKLPGKNQVASKEAIYGTKMDSFGLTRNYSANMLMMTKSVWNQKERAFIYIAPDAEGNSVLKYYYPETKTAKTVLKVNDFINLKKCSHLKEAVRKHGLSVSGS